MSCPELVACEFDRLHCAMLRRSLPISSAGELEGEVLLWHHDGVHSSGTVELCADRTVRWSGGLAHGRWHIDADGLLVATFTGGYGAPEMHKLELVSGERLVLRHPQRSPPSFAERPLGHLASEGHRQLSELQLEKKRQQWPHG